MKMQYQCKSPPALPHLFPARLSFLFFVRRNCFVEIGSSFFSGFPKHKIKGLWGQRLGKQGTSSLYVRARTLHAGTRSFIIQNILCSESTPDTLPPQWMAERHRGWVQGREEEQINTTPRLQHPYIPWQRHSTHWLFKRFYVLSTEFPRDYFHTSVKPWKGHSNRRLMIIL